MIKKLLAAAVQQGGKPVLLAKVVRLQTWVLIVKAHLE